MHELLSQPNIALFFIMTLGVALSKIRIGKVSLGSSSVVLVALVFGHFGFIIPAAIESIGLILFIFAVGIQTGPGFFESFKTGEAREYFPTVFITLILIASFSVLFSRLVGLSPLFAAGLFSGMSTSSAAFASIVEATNSKEAILAYSISYPICLITTILTTKVLLQFLKVDLDEEEKNYLEIQEKIHPKIVAKHYVVENPNLFNKSLSELKIATITGALVTRVKKRTLEESTIPHKNLVLEENDCLKIIGDDVAQEKVSLFIGHEAIQKIQISNQEKITSVLVTNKEAIGKRLVNLNLTGLWGAEITKIRRSGQDLIPHGNTRLRFGDKVQVAVNKDTEENLIKMLGGLESKSIDFLSLSLSIVIGIIIGQISIPFGDVSISPGVSGGILIATLLLGRLGKTGPLLWSIAGSTNQFLRELGLMFFLCGVGSRTGEKLVSAISIHGIQTAIASFLVIVISITLTAFIVLKFQKISKLRFVGALSGSLTCAASLPANEDINNSTIPLTAYSVTYPFALMMTILIGQILLLLS